MQRERNMKLGFIGLGVMGAPMARNLMQHGHQMGVYARRAETAAPLVQAGAVRHATPAALAADAEVIFTVVTNSSDVEQVVLGDDGIIHGARAGSVLVDMETISPTVARSIAQALGKKGIEMLDAPVSGGPMGAEQASLSIMAGGKTAVFARVKPLFECLGKTIVHVGDSGAGQITKACNPITNEKLAKNFPITISQSDSGFVNNNSIVPPFFSSAKLRIVMAGIRNIKMYGQSENMTLMSA
jgi:2-hydroxy-3-oxopropionate reductase